MYVTFHKRGHIRLWKRELPCYRFFTTATVPPPRHGMLANSQGRQGKKMPGWGAMFTHTRECKARRCQAGEQCLHTPCVLENIGISPDMIDYDRLYLDLPYL